VRRSRETFPSSASSTLRSSTRLSASITCAPFRTPPLSSARNHRRDRSTALSA
jgi:hypothetical protein